MLTANAQKPSVRLCDMSLPANDRHVPWTGAEKVEQAQRLEATGVVATVATGLAFSPLDFDMAGQVAQNVRDAVVSLQVRSNERDVLMGAAALGAFDSNNLFARPCLHVVCGDYDTLDQVQAAVELATAKMAGRGTVAFELPEPLMLGVRNSLEMTHRVVNAGASVIVLPCDADRHDANDLGSMVAKMTKAMGDRPDVAFAAYAQGTVKNALLHSRAALSAGAHEVAVSLGGVGGYAPLEELASKASLNADSLNEALAFQARLAAEMPSGGKADKALTRFVDPFYLKEVLEEGGVEMPSVARFFDYFRNVACARLALCGERSVSVAETLEMAQHFFEKQLEHYRDRGGPMQMVRGVQGEPALANV